MWAHEQGPRAKLSMSSMEGGQTKQGGGKKKNAHFFHQGGGEQLASMRGVGVDSGAQMKAHGKLKQALEAWLKRRSVCVCVCVFV